MKNRLVGGASLQSRAHRPVPVGWTPKVVARSGCQETWDMGDGHLRQMLTWVFDQGGPVLGYTSPDNPLTRLHALLWTTVPYGPGSVVSKWEIDAADLLLQIVGKYVVGEGDRARFFSDGSDAVDAAVRVARAATGRSDVISIGYHGTSLVFAEPPQNCGVARGPSDTLQIRWLDDPPSSPWVPACVVVEVPSTDQDAAAYLARLRNYCDQTGARLILDEVATGFRLALGGAAELYGIGADLLCYGKTMSNGRPISALVGPAKMLDRLDKDVFYSNTFNGDPHSCAQVVATLEYLMRNQEMVYPKLWGVGESFRQRMAAAGVKVVGHAPRTFVEFSAPAGEDSDPYIADKTRQEFCRRMVARGVVIDRPNYASLAHRPEDIQYTAVQAKMVLQEMQDAMQR